MEQDTDQNAFVIQDRDLVGGLRRTRGRVEHAAQVDHRDHRAAQGEHACQESWRQRQRDDLLGQVDHFADAMGGQGELVRAQHKGAEQLGGRGRSRCSGLRVLHAMFPGRF
jgi:hypothetical protein